VDVILNAADHRRSLPSDAHKHVLTFPRSHIPTFSHSHVPTFPHSHIPTFPRSHHSQSCVVRCSFDTSKPRCFRRAVSTAKVSSGMEGLRDNIQQYSRLGVPTTA